MKRLEKLRTPPPSMLILSQKDYLAMLRVAGDPPKHKTRLGLGGAKLDLLRCVSYSSRKGQTKLSSSIKCDLFKD